MSRKLARNLSSVVLLIFYPHMKTSPFVGLSIVPMMLSIVVLPPPEVPKIVINSPSLISTLTPKESFLYQKKSPN